MPAAPAGLRRCQDADLVLTGTSDRRPHGVGHLTMLAFTSIARSPCAVDLVNEPMDMLAADGTGIPGQFAGGAMTMPEAMTVRPGQVVQAVAGWNPDTGETRRVVAIRVYVGGSGPGFRVPVEDDGVRPAPVAVPSGGSMEQSAAVLRFVAVSNAGTPASLTAALTAPLAIATGDTVTAQVTLDNLTDVPVPLAPCPTTVLQLRVAVGKKETVTGVDGHLDCAGGGDQVPAHGHRVQDVSMPVGDIASDGVLTWAITDGAVAVVRTDAYLTVHR